MFLFRERGSGLYWFGLFAISIPFFGSTTLAQVNCTKPDAGPDVSTTATSTKLKDAPNGYFWCMPSGNPNTAATVHAQTGQVSGLTTPGQYRFVLCSVANSLSMHAAGATPQDGALRSNTINGPEFLDNGQIKVGVDSRYGGAITYLAPRNGTNMVNNFDLGRQIQIAAYSGPVPFAPPGVDITHHWAGIGWNPLQAGDYYNNPGKILAFEKRDNLLYVKTLAQFWPLRNYNGEVVIEHWVRLAGNAVRVHVRVTLNRADKKQYQARDQEFPCLYLNSIYKRSWKYTGSAPYTNADKELKVAPFDMVNVRSSEPWIALTRDDDFGVGLYTPGNMFFREAFFGDDFNDNEFSGSTSYIAGAPFAILDHNSVTDFDYELVVGHINDIRSYIYSQPRPDKGPNYRFTNSRHSWYYHEASDTGLPTTSLDVKLEGYGQHQIKSPAFFWKGSDNPKIYVRAAFNVPAHSTYRMQWRTQEDYEFLGMPERRKDFQIINDGQFRTYEIDLTNTSWTSSAIRQIMFAPPVLDRSTVNGSIKIEWISNSPTGPTDAPQQPTSSMCSDTVMVTVTAPVVRNEVPDAGPDQVLRCGVTSVDLPARPGNLVWRMLSRPAGSTATITATGAVRGLQKPGLYLITLSNDAARTVDLMSITVPTCNTPQSLSSVVFLDNGTGGGIARNGKQESGELGIANVSVSLYTDPNGDGSPADGLLVERVRTNSQGVYQFSQLFANEFYVIALDPINFSLGRPLFRTISTRQANYSNDFGLLSGRIVLKNPQADAIILLSARAKAADLDPSFGVAQDCVNQTPICLPIQATRLR
jgi:hypothetical protein